MGCEEVNEGSHVGSCLCGCVGDVCAAAAVQGFSGCVEVKALAQYSLEKVGHKHRLRNAAGWDQTTILAMAKGSGRKVPGTMQRDDVPGSSQA